MEMAGELGEVLAPAWMAWLCTAVGADASTPYSNPTPAGNRDAAMIFAGLYI